MRRRAARASGSTMWCLLCLQDTTEFDYRGQTIEGLGPLSYEARRGLYLHPTYVVTPEREPLGVINAWTWACEATRANSTWHKLCAMR